uniref:Armadillo repeat-containing domain-containing protein n=1 Tax=Trichobilharzia regenti TaxID=157069 RepID=A0AA85KQ72_TRIRE|nr:unnamed protein product [Trichobilharzia regenti]
MNKSSVLLVSSVFAVSACTLFYLSKLLRKPHVKKDIQKTAPHSTIGDTYLKTVNEFDKENLSIEFANCICSMVKVSDYDTRQQLIMYLHQASSFCHNFSVIRDSKCLETLLSLLDSSTSMAPACRQNLSILQVTTNLACDQRSLPIIMDYLDDIFSIADTREYSDQACAALQVLANIALTPTGCNLLINDCGRLYKMLGVREPYLLRNLLAVLVNLSCDVNCCDKLLSQNGEDFVRILEYSLSLDVPLLISMKMTTFLNNLYSRIMKDQERYWNESESAVITKTVAISLKENRDLIQSWAQCLLPFSEDSNEFNAHLQKLLSFLTDIKTFNV